MISELMKDWLGYVWERRSGALSEPRSMLAMDGISWPSEIDQGTKPLISDNF
jgi:hypothetical protein